jgi:hypothetical protein
LVEDLLEVIAVVEASQGIMDGLFLEFILQADSFDRRSGVAEQQFEQPRSIFREGIGLDGSHLKDAEVSDRGADQGEIF